MEATRVRSCRRCKKRSRGVNEPTRKRESIMENLQIKIGVEVEKVNSGAVGRLVIT